MWWKKRELVFSSFFSSLFFFVEYDLGYHRSLAKKCNFVLWKNETFSACLYNLVHHQLIICHLFSIKFQEMKKSCWTIKITCPRRQWKILLTRFCNKLCCWNCVREKRGVKPREKLFNGQLDTIRQPKHDVSRKWKIAQVMFKHQLEQFRHHSPHPKLHGKYTTCTFSRNMHCLKIAEKVAFQIASKASYVCILIGQNWWKLP